MLPPLKMMFLAKRGRIGSAQAIIECTIASASPTLVIPMSLGWNRSSGTVNRSLFKRRIWQFSAISSFLFLSCMYLETWKMKNEDTFRLVMVLPPSNHVEIRQNVINTDWILIGR